MNTKSKEVAVLEKEINPAITKASKITIHTAEDMVKATEVLSNLNRYADTVTEKKESITKPLNAALKAARQMFVPLETKLEDAIGGVRKAMITYQTEAVRKQKEEEAKIAARIGEGKGKIKIETAVEKLQNIEKAPEKIATDAGQVKFKTVKKFEITDISALPREFMVPNEVEIRKAMLAGIEVTGVRYYEEQVPYNSR